METILADILIMIAILGLGIMLILFIMILGAYLLDGIGDLRESMRRRKQWRSK